MKINFTAFLFEARVISFLGCIRIFHKYYKPAGRKVKGIYEYTYRAAIQQKSKRISPS